MKYIKRVFKIVRATFFRGICKIASFIRAFNQSAENESEDPCEETLGCFNLERLFEESLRNPQMSTEMRWVVVCNIYKNFKRDMKKSMTGEDLRRLNCRHEEILNSLLMLDRQFSGLQRHYKNLIEDAEKRYETAVYDYWKARIKSILKKGVTKEEWLQAKLYASYRKKRLWEFKAEVKTCEKICKEVDAMMDELKKDGYSIKKGMMKARAKRKVETTKTEPRKRSLDVIIKNAQGRIEQPKKERGLQR